MNKTRIWIASLILLIVISGCSQGKSNKVRIGVLQYAEHPSLDAAYIGMVEYLEEVMGAANIDVQRVNAQGDSANNDMMAQKLASDNYDLLYAIGTNSAQALYAATYKSKTPLVFNAVTDPVTAELVESLDKPGGHATGVSDLAPVEKQLATLKEMLPNVQRIGVLYNLGEINSIVQIEKMDGISEGNGLKIIKQGISSAQDLPTATTQLVGKVDAIFNITDNLVVSGTSMVVEIATKKEIPVIASEDGQIDSGILMAESLGYNELGREAGEIIVEILNGRLPGEIPVKNSDATKLYINEEVARKLNIQIPSSLQERGVVH